MVTKENYEEYMMLYADNELSAEEERALLAFVKQHPELKAELKAYAATRLYADETIVFEEKDSLLKEPAKRIALLSNWKTYAAAACALLIVSTIILNTKNDLDTYTPIAGNDITIIPETTIPEPPAEEPTVKKLYSSKPVATIAMETKKQPQKKQTITHTQHIARQQEEVVVLNALKSSANFEVREQPVEMTNVDLPTINPVLGNVQQTESSTVAIKAPFAKAPEGLHQIEEIFNEKLTAAKNIKEKIDNTEVKFHFGKKELFIVRL